jgi:glycosyltransferase involved in cell wall biosynthesis
VQKRSILIITLEPIAGKMAGPAIRSLELGRQLANEFSVTVFSPQVTTENSQPLVEANDQLKIVCGGGRNRLYSLTEQADILFIQANVLKAFPTLTRSGKYLVVDLYDPYLFSLFEQYAEDEATASSSYRLMHQVLEKHMVAADFSVCASERQRDYWLGRYCALGKITPQIYKLDRSLRNLIDVVPFGVQDKPPVQSRNAIKGTVPGISPQDLVLLWGGGIWDWFDPLTIISAVDTLKNRLPNLRLYFMGSKSPNKHVPLMAMAKSARTLAEERGLLNKFVFFSDEWVSYDDRANYLLDADIAVSAHFDVIETRYSFRTRILDYFWAGLPILTTGGDDLADLIESNGAGFALPVQDQQAWADAIVRIAQDEQLKQSCKLASQTLAQRLHWSNVVQPLQQFCREPYHLPAFTRVTMPSLIERAQAVYSRGGKELVIQRSKELFGDLLR